MLPARLLTLSFSQFRWYTFQCKIRLTVRGRECRNYEKEILINMSKWLLGFHRNPLMKFTCVFVVCCRWVYCRKSLYKLRHHDQLSLRNIIMNVPKLTQLISRRNRVQPLEKARPIPLDFILDKQCCIWLHTTIVHRCVKNVYHQQEHAHICCLNKVPKYDNSYS